VFPSALLPALVDTLGRPIAADGERETSRPLLEELFLSEVIYPQDRGEMQVSTGLELERDGRRSRFSVPLQIEYGITERLQMELSMPYEHDGATDESGIGNVGVGVLYQLARDESDALRFALGAEFAFPSSSAGVGIDTVRTRIAR
jgi:hypothetical protein